jgi:hypothetical protein
MSDTKSRNSRRRAKLANRVKIRAAGILFRQMWAIDKNGDRDCMAMLWHLREVTRNLPAARAIWRFLYWSYVLLYPLNRVRVLALEQMRESFAALGND